MAPSSLRFSSEMPLNYHWWDMWDERWNACITALKGAVLDILLLAILNDHLSKEQSHKLALCLPSTAITQRRSLTHTAACHPQRPSLQGTVSQIGFLPSFNCHYSKKQSHTHYRLPSSTTISPRNSLTNWLFAFLQLPSLKEEVLHILPLAILNDHLSKEKSHNLAFCHRPTSVTSRSSLTRSRLPSIIYPSRTVRYAHRSLWEIPY
ncbi:hypothetical protein J6590_032810 [Homalodisca vitripennis]|nr:hypothetical protein J6590_032810 [Homalodisca vitripennis]